MHAAIPRHAFVAARYSGMHSPLLFERLRCLTAVRNVGACAAVVQRSPVLVICGYRGARSMPNTEIDGERLWSSLMELARIGATPKGGVRRITLTPADREGRELFARWCREAALEVRVDAIGNMFARRAGADAAAAPVMMGSHLDTQPNGGKFDGAYGVMAGLEVIPTLTDPAAKTRAPLEAARGPTEEGSRSFPTIRGSRVLPGSLRPE